VEITLRGCLGAVARWLLLSVVSFALYWLLWFLMDRATFDLGGYAWGVILFDFAYCSAYCALAMAVCHLMHRIFVRRIRERWAYVCSSFASLLVNIAIAAAFEVVVWNADEDVRSTGIFIFSLIATFMSALMLSGRSYNLYREQNEAYREAEMERLKSQLDPHFLFNSLAALDGLMESDMEKAHDYLAKLSRIYRRVLDSMDADSVEVCGEVGFVRSYADLLSVRYGGQFSLEIGGGLDDCHRRMLPMSLQLLLENAIKHNAHSEESPVRVIVEMEGDCLSVRNTYRPNSVSKESHKVGLQNMRKRYRIFSGRDCEMSSSDGWFEIKIPTL